MLALPWAFKFLWAPLVDMLRAPGWTRRSWIIAAQVLMGLLLLPLLGLDLRDQLPLVTVLLMAHAFAAATQDVAVDALSIASVPPEERGSINGWMQAGMLTGRSLLGGSALIMAAAVGDGGLIVAVVLVVWSSLALLLCSREPPTPARNREGMRTFGAQLVAAVKRRSTVLGLLFAALAGAGFEAVGAVAGPFLIDRGVAEDQIGWFFTVVSVPCMIAGALVGGPLSDRLGKRRAVAILLVTLASAIVALALGDASLPPLQVAPRLALLAVVYVAIGLFTAASYALFMDLTDVRLAATQFTAFMALTNVCESWSSFAVGRLVPAYGYPMAFALLAGASLLSLPLLPAMTLDD
jgi:MFS family permease